MNSRKAQAFAWAALLLLGPGLTIWVLCTARVELQLRNGLDEPIRNVRLLVAEDEEWRIDELKPNDWVADSFFVPAELVWRIEYRTASGEVRRETADWVYLTGRMRQETVRLVVTDGGVRPDDW